MNSTTIETMLSAMKDQESRRFQLQLERPEIQWAVKREQDQWSISKLEGDKPYEAATRGTLQETVKALTFDNGKQSLYPVDYKLSDALRDLTSGVPMSSIPSADFNKPIRNVEVANKNGQEVLHVAFNPTFPGNLGKLPIDEALKAREAYENRLPTDQRFGTFELKQVPHLAKETRNHMLDQAASGLLKPMVKDLVR